MFCLAPSIAAHGQSITLILFARKSLASSSHVTYTIFSHVTHHQLKIPILAPKGILFSPVSSKGYLLTSVHGPDGLRTRCNPPAPDSSSLCMATYTGVRMVSRFWKKVHNLLREIVSDLLVIISIESSLRKMSVFGYETTVGYETTDRHRPCSPSRLGEQIIAPESTLMLFIIQLFISLHHPCQFNEKHTRKHEEHTSSSRFVEKASNT